MDSLSSQVAQRLLQINAIKINISNPFKWASGIMSPIYCDNRVILSNVEVREFICDAFIKKLEFFEQFDVIAGVATGGIAHGYLLADRLKKPFVYVRTAPKGHGLQNQIEGQLHQKSKVLVIEDLISTGGSSINAIQALKVNGNTIAGCLSIFSYCFDTSFKIFEQNGVKLKSLSDYPSLIDHLQRENRIDHATLEHLKLWNKDPHQWNLNK